MANTRKQRNVGIVPLFDQLKSENCNLSSVVQSWHRFYEASPSPAFVEILNFILQIGGVRRNFVTTQKLHQMSQEDLLVFIHENSSNSDDYPLVSKLRLYRKLYDNFQLFWISLVSELSDELYDGKLMQFVVTWLSNLSFSKWKGLRHTATVSIVSIIQAIGEILSKEIQDLERVKTFVNSEKKNGKTIRLVNLKAQKQEIQHRIEYLHKILQNVMDDIMYYRYKDIMYDIRAICIQSIGNIALKFPRLYFTEQSLQSLRLLIYDKNQFVRERTLQIILRLYQQKECEEIMKTFTDINKERLVEICYDIELKCAVVGIQICTILALMEELSQKQIDAICCLIWVKQQDIRKEASKFIWEVIFQWEFNQNLQKYQQKLDKGRSISAEKGILSFMNFFEQYADGDLSRVQMLIVSFWEMTPIVKDWEVMCQLIKRGGFDNNKQSLRSDQIIIILKMLISCLQNTMENQSQRSNDVSIELTSTLLTNLSDIIQLYKNDKVIIENIVKLLPSLDLNALQSKDLKNSFGQILQDIRELFFLYDDVDIISYISKTLSHFTERTHGLVKQATDILQMIVQESIAELHDSIQKFNFQENEGTLESWLTRIMCLLKIQDFIHEYPDNLVQDVSRMLSLYLNNGIQSPVIGMRTGFILYLIHLWNLHKLSNDPNHLDTYLESRDKIIELLITSIAKQESPFDLKYQAFQLTCESLILVSGQPAHNSPILYRISDDLWDILEDFMLSVPIKPSKPKVQTPSKALQKAGVKLNNIKEDADEVSTELCLIVGRLVGTCPAVTLSQLTSSYLAYYAYTSYPSLSILTKQVLNNFKTKDLQSNGPFRDGNLLFGIMLDSMIKVYGKGQEEDLVKMKNLAKKFQNVMGAGAMRPKQAERFKIFLEEGVRFSLSSALNLNFLEGLMLFIKKQYLNPSQYGNLHDRIQSDLRQLQNEIQGKVDDAEALLKPLQDFLYELARNAGYEAQKPSRVSQARRATAVDRGEESKQKGNRDIKKQSLEIQQPNEEVEKAQIAQEEENYSRNILSIKKISLDPEQQSQIVEKVQNMKKVSLNLNREEQTNTNQGRNVRMKKHSIQPAEIVQMKKQSIPMEKRRILPFGRPIWLIDKRAKTQVKEDENDTWMMDLLENAGNVNLPAKRNRTDGKPPTKKHKS